MRNYGVVDFWVSRNSGNMTCRCIWDDLEWILIRLHSCGGWSEASQEAHAILYVLLCSDSIHTSIICFCLTGAKPPPPPYTATAKTDTAGTQPSMYYMSQSMTKQTKWSVHPAKIGSAWAPPSLIRVFAVCMKKHWVLSYPLSPQRSLIRLDGCPGWSESLLGAQVILVLLCSSSVITIFKHGF